VTIDQNAEKTKGFALALARKGKQKKD